MLGRPKVRNRLLVIAAALAVATAVVPTGIMAWDGKGNSGTIKVHDDADAQPDMRNQPHISCEFWIEGFKMQGDSGTLVFMSWPPTGDKSVVKTLAWTGSAQEKRSEKESSREESKESSMSRSKTETKLEVKETTRTHDGVTETTRITKSETKTQSKTENKSEEKDHDESTEKMEQKDRFHFLAGPITLAAGHYRVEAFLTDGHPGKDDHFAKAKMFWVEACTPTSGGSGLPPPVTSTQPGSEAPSSSTNAPTETPSVPRDTTTSSSPAGHPTSKPTTTASVPFFPSSTALALGTVGALAAAFIVLRRRG